MALTLMPGPDILYLISQSVLYGKRSGVLITLGLVTGLLFHTLMVVFGLAIIIKILGSLYIAYLGFISIKKAYFMKSNLKSFTEEDYGGFYKGLLMNLLNPKVSLFFLAVFPGFLFSQTLSVQFQFMILGSIFFIQALAVFIIVTILSDLYFKSLKNSLGLRKSILKLQGIILILISIFILLI